MRNLLLFQFYIPGTVYNLLIYLRMLYICETSQWNGHKWHMAAYFSHLGSMFFSPLLVINKKRKGVSIPWVLSHSLHMHCGDSLAYRHTGQPLMLFSALLKLSCVCKRTKKESLNHFSNLSIPLLSALFMSFPRLSASHFLKVSVELDRPLCVFQLDHSY